ncbi:MAG: hypothetical protein JXD23_13215 [Spirochaetales bacterium]|nr:hypothetical protein [Spirochaetales bacterium]
MNKAIELFKEYAAANDGSGNMNDEGTGILTGVQDLIDEIGLIPYGTDLFSTNEFDDQLHPGYLMLEFAMKLLDDRIEKKGLAAFVEEAKVGIGENDFIDCYFMKCVKYAVRSRINADATVLEDLPDSVRSWIEGNVPEFLDVKLTFMYEEDIISKTK